MEVTCLQCGKAFDKRPADIARSPSKRFFCSNKCTGLARRKWKTRAQKVLEKAAYDADYRKRNRDRLKQAHREYHLRTYDREQARKRRASLPESYHEQRARHMATPAYRAAKKAYDEELRASQYGEFAECYRLYLELIRVIRKRQPDKYLRARERGYYERVNAQRRKKNGSQI